MLYSQRDLISLPLSSVAICHVAATLLAFSASQSVTAPPRLQELSTASGHEYRAKLSRPCSPPLVRHARRPVFTICRCALPHDTRASLRSSSLSASQLDLHATLHRSALDALVLLAPERWSSLVALRQSVSFACHRECPSSPPRFAHSFRVTCPSRRSPSFCLVCAPSWLPTRCFDASQGRWRDEIWRATTCPARSLSSSPLCSQPSCLSCFLTSSCHAFRVILRARRPPIRVPFARRHVSLRLSLEHRQNSGE